MQNEETSSGIAGLMKIADAGVNEWLGGYAEGDAPSLDADLSMYTTKKPSGLQVGSVVKLSGTTDWLKDDPLGTVRNSYIPQAYYDYSYWSTLRSNRVRLKLSEVEALREAVADNKKVRAILNRLAHLIEIEVDF